MLASSCKVGRFVQLTLRDHGTLSLTVPINTLYPCAQRCNALASSTTSLTLYNTTATTPMADQHTLFILTLLQRGQWCNKQRAPSNVTLRMIAPIVMPLFLAVDG